MIAEQWPGVDPNAVMEWDENVVLDALQIIERKSAYVLRHKFDRPDDIDARTGIPLE